VKKGDLLYAIDARDVRNSIARAELSMRQAQLSYDALLEQKADNMDNLELRATADGVLQTLYIETGDTVTAGTPVAVILDRDVMALTLPFHSNDAKTFFTGQTAAVTVGGTLETFPGTVDKVSGVDEGGAGGALVRQVTIKVRNPGAITASTTGTAAVGGIACSGAGTFAYGAQETLVAKTSGKLAELYVSEGDRVTKGQVLGVYKSADLDNQIENARIGLESAKLSLENARNALKNYNITSPISGTVVEKNFKAGDNIESASSGYLAVIYDLSLLTFEMNIDELDIGKVKVGQKVEITAEALAGQTFTGHVDRININATTVSGVTTYPVTVVIDDPGLLLPGMNVTADIIVERAADVLSIPVDAVQRGNTVLIPGEGAYDQNGRLSDFTSFSRCPSHWAEATKTISKSSPVWRKAPWWSLKTRPAAFTS
jgi:HlyD family secretion protein